MRKELFNLGEQNPTRSKLADLISSADGDVQSVWNHLFFSDATFHEKMKWAAYLLSSNAKPAWEEDLVREICFLMPDLDIESAAVAENRKAKKALIQIFSHFINIASPSEASAFDAFSKKDEAATPLLSETFGLLNKIGVESSDFADLLYLAGRAKDKGFWTGPHGASHLWERVPLFQAIALKKFSTLKVDEQKKWDNVKKDFIASLISLGFPIVNKIGSKSSPILSLLCDWHESITDLNNIPEGLISILINNGCDPNATDNLGASPLATLNGTQSSREAAFKYDENPVLAKKVFQLASELLANGALPESILPKQPNPEDVASTEMLAKIIRAAREKKEFDSEAQSGSKRKKKSI